MPCYLPVLEGIRMLVRQYTGAVLLCQERREAIGAKGYI